MERIGEKFKEKVSHQCFTYGWIVALAIIIALIWIIIASLIDKKCCDCIALISSLVFLIVLFSGTALVFWKMYKKEADVKEKSNDFNRKIDWEEFQYELNKEERNEKLNYERIEKLINNLDNKEIVDNHTLKQEFEKLKQEFKEWKVKKDKQVFIEITKDTDKTK